MNAPRIQTAKKLHADKSMVIADICKTLQISRPTLYRWLPVKPPAAAEM
jgi:predicted DNA-binding transcriptional regulator AlpA